MARSFLLAKLGKDLMATLGLLLMSLMIVSPKLLASFWSSKVRIPSKWFSLTNLIDKASSSHLDNLNQSKNKEKEFPIELRLSRKV